MKRLSIFVLVCILAMAFCLPTVARAANHPDQPYPYDPNICLCADNTWRCACREIVKPNPNNNGQIPGYIPLPGPIENPNEGGGRTPTNPYPQYPGYIPLPGPIERPGQGGGFHPVPPCDPTKSVCIDSLQGGGKIVK